MSMEECKKLRDEMVAKGLAALPKQKLRKRQKKTERPPNAKMPPAMSEPEGVAEPSEKKKK